MEPLLVVEVEVATQVLYGLRDRPVLVEIDLLVFHGTPEPFNEDVVEDASSAVHADLNPAVLQAPGKVQAGKLAPLIGIEDLRLGVRQSPIQGFLIRSCFFM